MLLATLFVMIAPIPGKAMPIKDVKATTVIEKFIDAKVIPAAPDVSTNLVATVTTSTATRKNADNVITTKKAATIGFTDSSPGFVATNYSKDKAGTLVASYKDNPTAIKNVSSTTNKNTDVNDTSPAGYITDNTDVQTNTAAITTIADVPDKVSWNK